MKKKRAGIKGRIEYGKNMFSKQTGIKEKKALKGKMGK